MKTRSSEREEGFISPDPTEFYREEVGAAMTRADRCRALEDEYQAEEGQESSPEDVDDRITNGILDVMLEAKESGKTRHIGFTGHQNPYAHVHMLERTKENDIFETVQMPINPVDAGNKDSFISEVIQEANSRNFGILAMKTLAAGRFFPETIIADEKVWESEDPVVPARIALRDVMNFAWSLPISVLITGAENKSFISEKIDMAREFSKLSEKQRLEIIDKVEDIALKGDVEYYKNV